MLTGRMTTGRPAVGIGPARLLPAITQAIAAIGETDFADRLLGAKDGLVEAEHCSAFLLDRRDGPRCLGAASFDGSPTALAAAEHYVATYWHEDPALQRLRGASFEAQAGMGRVTSDEIRNAAYRRDCYDRPRVIDRITLYRDLGGQRLFLSVFRGPRRGFFGTPDIEALGAAADALTTGLARHHRFGLPRPGAPEPEASGLSRERVSQILEALCAGLSPREREVCALSVLGGTAEEVAARLGIQASSVTTYRKRAYAKLGVSSSVALAGQCLRMAERLGGGVPALPRKPLPLPGTRA